MKPKLRGSQNKDVFPRPALSRQPSRVQPLTLPPEAARPFLGSAVSAGGWSARAAGLLGEVPSAVPGAGQGIGSRLLLFSRFLLQPRGNPEVATRDWAPGGTEHAPGRLHHKDTCAPALPGVPSRLEKLGTDELLGPRPCS